MARIHIAGAIAAIALTACSGAATEDDRTPSDGVSEAAAPTPSLSLRSMKPSPPDSLPGDLSGVLGLAEIETGCPYLESADGTRYEVMYPDGWELRRSPLELVAPDGTTVARAGDEVTVRGSVSSDMASVCQIGPIFRATEVVAGD